MATATAAVEKATALWHVVGDELRYTDAGDPYVIIQTVGEDGFSGLAIDLVAPGAVADRLMAIAERVCVSFNSFDPLVEALQACTALLSVATLDGKSLYSAPAREKARAALALARQGE